MWGNSFEDLRHKIKLLKNNINSPVKQIVISLVTTQSYQNIEDLTNNETKLLAIILNEFKNFGITINDINFVYSSQVQISPNGEISTYTKRQMEEHKQNMFMSDLDSFGEYVNPELNIYITKYGDYMGNCSLNTNSSDEEKRTEFSSNYWQEYIGNGYELVIGPSFNDPDCLAIYVTNWDDPNIQKYGTVPGCRQAKTFNSLDLPFKAR